MAVRLVIDPVRFLRIAKRLNDIELGALMRALAESSLDDNKPKNILEASYFGCRTNGFYHLTPDDCISSSDCNFAHSFEIEEKKSVRVEEAAHV